MHLLEKFRAKRVSLKSRELISACHASSADTDAGEVYQLFLESEEGAFPYKVGDSLGIFPQNPSYVVEGILDSLGCSAHDLVSTPRTSSLSIRQFLSSYANVDKFPEKLREYFSPETTHTNLYDSLRKEQPKIPIERFVQALFPLLPRFYSIASSPQPNPNELELLVRLVSYPGAHEKRYGVCSFFLCRELELGGNCYAFVQPTKHFTLGDSHRNKPIVMIGSGTGIAPYKGFIQHRLHHKDSGDNVLFFGERFRQTNFYYQDFWTHAVHSRALQLFLAFSRDTEKKIYVQDLLREQHALVTKLYEEGASFFVCGSKDLGSEVKTALEEILGKEQLAGLRAEHRYVVDVY